MTNTKLTDAIKQAIEKDENALLFGIREASKYTGRTEDVVRRMCNSVPPQMPFVDVSREPGSGKKRIRFSKKMLDDWIASRTHTVGTPATSKDRELPKVVTSKKRTAKRVPARVK